MKYPKEAMAQIQDSFTVKSFSIKEPKRYLGYDINKVYFINGYYRWIMGADIHVTLAVNNLNGQMAT